MKKSGHPPGFPQAAAFITTSPKSTVPPHAPENVSCPDLDLIRNRYAGEDNDSIEFLPGPTAAFHTDRMNTPAKWYRAPLFRGKEKFFEDRVSFTPHETTRQSFFCFEMSLLLSCPLPFTRIRGDAVLEKKRKMPHFSPAKHLTGGPENEIPKKPPMAARWSGATTSTCNGNLNKKMFGYPAISSWISRVRRGLVQWYRYRYSVWPVL